MLSFYKQQWCFSQIVSKKAKIQSFMANSEKKILFWDLVFSFMYLVSVYPTNRTLVFSVLPIQRIGQKTHFNKLPSHL